MKLTLPWPPSTNKYWRHPSRGPLAGRHLISDEGRKYRSYVIEEVAKLGLKASMTQRLCVVVKANPPDRRRRDLDNILKSLLDALTHAEVWVDDEQIDALTVFRTTQLDGFVEINIVPVDSTKAMTLNLTDAIGSMVSR